MITFVTHYQHISEEERKDILQLCTSALIWKPQLLIDLMFASAEKFHKGCRKVVLTNETTPVDLGKGIEVIRYPTQKYKNRLAEMISIKRFLSECDGSAHIVYLDFDMLVQSNLEHIFDNDFDVFFSIRPAGESDVMNPINMGFAGIRKGSESKGAAIYDAIINQILPFNEFHAWGGSQLGIHKLLTSARRIPDANFLGLDLNGIKVCILPDTYNYTPPEWKIKTPMLKKKVLHFRGFRKIDMPKYWNKYLKDL